MKTFRFLSLTAVAVAVLVAHAPAVTHEYNKLREGFIKTETTAPFKLLNVLDPLKKGDVKMCFLATGRVVPADATVGYAPGALFFNITGSGGTTIYKNNGTWASSNFDALNTDQISALDVDDIADATGHTHAFTGTSQTADDLAIRHDATPTNQTAVYLAADRGKIAPGVLTSENAGAATSYVESSAGSLLPIVYRPLSDATITMTHNSSALLTKPLFLRLLGGPNQWGAIEGELVSESDTLASFGFNTSSPTDTALVKFYNETKSLNVPLTSVRELDTSDIPNAAAIGGLLAKNTTPILEATNGATDTSLRLHWAAGNNDSVVFKTHLPFDIDTTRDLRIYIRAAVSGAVDNPAINTITFFDEGDTGLNNNTNAVEETTVGGVFATVTEASIPVGAQSITVVITPGAHTTDALYIYSIAIQYVTIHDMVPVYFHQTATNTYDRFLQANTYGKDVYVRLASGRLWKFKYSATASATGVLVRSNAAAAAAAERLIFTSGTTSNGTAITGTRYGAFALDGLWTTPVYYKEDYLVYDNSAELLKGLDVPIYSATGNRLIYCHAEIVDGTYKAVYFDDDYATDTLRLVAALASTENESAAFSTANTPYGTTAVGTVAAKTIQNTEP